ncbi:Translation machinery-associated protein 46 [Saitoella coloradoensis]
MPPKGKGQQPKEKSVKVDKTFGMKNKNKSAKVQNFVNTVKQQEAQAGKNSKAAKAKEDEKDRIAAKRVAEEKKKAELAELFKPALIQPKVPFGVDPKTILCVFWKQEGKCAKGEKCKFSHDLNVGRRVVKKDLYTDVRDELGEAVEEDKMDDWDEERLAAVVLSKHGNPKTTTDIVCRFFLEAVENNKYGWRWECPNGGNDCKYRHALPPGFVLKTRGDKKNDKKVEITLEDFIETERHRLGKNLTPVTLETFNKWKKERIERKEADEKDNQKKIEAQVKAGRAGGMVSGRNWFVFRPDLLDDDDEGYGQEDEWDLTEYRKNESDDEAEENGEASGDAANGDAEVEEATEKLEAVELAE